MLLQQRETEPTHPTLDKAWKKVTIHSLETEQKEIKRIKSKRKWGTKINTEK